MSLVWRSGCCRYVGFPLGETSSERGVAGRLVSLASTWSSAQTWPRPTLLVKSKMHGKAVLHTRCEGQSDQGHASGDTHSHGVGDGPLRLNQQSHDLLYVGGEFRRLT